MLQTKGIFKTGVKESSIVLAVFMAIVAALIMCTAGSAKAYAADALAIGQESSGTVSTEASGVTYVAILGADTWQEGNGAKHSPACDFMAIARVDANAGTISLLTIPRDLYYANIRDFDKKATVYGSNCAFRDVFNLTVKSDWSNYEEALRAGAEATLKVMKDQTGIKVKKYAVVDLYTYQDIITKLKGVTVDIPVAIKDYVLYNTGEVFTINKGKTGNYKFDAHDAMIASRSRESYRRWLNADGTEKLLRYSKLSDYSGSYPELLLYREKANKAKSYYYFDGDATRQFLDRRTLGMLIDKALGKKEAWSFVWNDLVKTDLMWTNLTEKQVKTMGEALAKAKSSNKLMMYGASIIDSLKGGVTTIGGVDQWLIPIDSANKKKMKAAVKQFKAGKPMTSGWGAETILGITVGSKKKASGVTYKATSVKNVTVVSVPNKKNVVIPDTVKLNHKVYKVTGVAANSMKGSKVRSVTLGANIGKIASKAFANSKATKITIKSTLLTKAKVKGSLQNSKVTKIKVSVAKADKKKTVKKYKAYFAKSNSKASKSPKVS